MDKEKLTKIITAIIFIVAFMALWPLIKWLAIICLIAVVIGIIITYFNSKKITQQIKRNPIEYYQRNNSTNKQVIDVEYKEKEIVEEENN